MGQQGAVVRVKTRAEVGRATHKLGYGRRSRIKGIHLSLEGLELDQGNVAGATFSRRRCFQRAVGIELGRGKALCTLCCQRGFQDIGRGMKVVLCVTADQLLVLGKGHVALDDARAHASSRLVRLFCVFGEL